MFGLGSTPSSSSVDPDHQRAAPPMPTVVYFPQNEIRLSAQTNWAQRPPNLYYEYAHITKPSDVRLEHITDLNLTVENDVDLENFVPVPMGGTNYLPPRSWLQQGSLQSGRKDSSVHLFSHHKHALLNNGHKAPDQDTFYKYAQELTCGTEDALRAIGKRKPRPGHSAPSINHFRRFWSQMEVVSQYWDTSKDHYFEVKSSRSSEDQSRRSSLSNRNLFPDANKNTEGNLYTGFRISTGARMPEKYRIEAVKALVENIVWAFGCQMSPPRRVQLMQVKSLLIPVTQSSMIWRTPEDKSQSKIGVIEGPVLGMQCRNETAFLKDSHMVLTDTARELAGLLLLAQERARETKKKVIPGEGKWYTTKPRWGGGRGGEFGDAENRDKPQPKHTFISHNKQSDEEIWRMLQPGPGLWESRVSYVRVGKDRSKPHDQVFMISALYHHVCLLRFDVHPDYINFLETGKLPLYPDPNERWHMPTVRRTRWYDLLVPEDRGELLRALWGVLSYSMRNEGPSSDPRRPSAPQRQHSESSHFFSFRKKPTPAPHEPTPRSHSLT